MQEGNCDKININGGDLLFINSILIKNKKKKQIINYLLFNF